MELQEIREEFAKQASKFQGVRSSDNNSFGGFVTGADEYVRVGRWVCHGWLSDWNMESVHDGRSKYKKGGIKYVLSAVMKPYTDEDHLRTFIKWLANDSPWKDTHVDKDVDSILKYGWLVDANHCPSFITSGMIASRFLTESYMDIRSLTVRASVHKELLAQGFSGDEAFLFSHLFSSETDKSTYPISFNPWHSGHSTFFGSGWQEEYAKNFLTGKPKNLSAFKMSSGRGYQSYTINKIWGEQNGREDFFDAIKRLTPKSEQKKIDHHIFRKAPANGFAYRDSEDFLSILEQVKGRINA